MKTTILGTKNYKIQCNKIAKELVYDKVGIHTLFRPQLKAAMFFANLEVQKINLISEEEMFRLMYKEFEVPVEISYTKFKDISIACYEIYRQEIYKTSKLKKINENLHPTMQQCLTKLLERNLL